MKKFFMDTERPELPFPEIEARLGAEVINMIRDRSDNFERSIRDTEEIEAIVTKYAREETGEMSLGDIREMISKEGGK